jgi:hypothetical protein
LMRKGTVTGWKRPALTSCGVNSSRQWRGSPKKSSYLMRGAINSHQRQSEGLGDEAIRGMSSYSLSGPDSIEIDCTQMTVPRASSSSQPP